MGSECCRPTALVEEKKDPKATASAAEVQTAKSNISLRRMATPLYPQTSLPEFERDLALDRKFANV